MSIFGSIFTPGGDTFDEAEASMHGDVQAEFGEWFVHEPVLPPRPNYSETTPDPERPAYVVRAIFTGEHREARLGSTVSGVSTRAPEIEIRSGDLRYPVRKLDRFTRCATTEIFEATDVQPDTMSGRVVPLKQCGRKPA